MRGWAVGLVLMLFGAGLVVGAEPASATATIEPPFSADYSLIDLGPPPGVPSPLGGLTLAAGDPSKLLIGGTANGPSGAIYEISVTRDTGGHINGFSGTATLFATAPNIDGGLAYAPNGVLLYTAYPSHQIGEIKPGSTSPDKIVAAPGLSSVGTIGFVPPTHPGGGRFKVASYNGGTVDTAALTNDGSGTYDIGAGSDSTTVNGGPEGLAYVPIGAHDFANPGVLVSRYSAGDVQAYDVDANGNPDPSTARPFITGLSGAEGAFLDQTPGDFLFSTFGGGDHVLVVTGFAPPKTTTSTSTVLTSGSTSGTQIEVPKSTAVTDTSTLSGVDAATATGTMHYVVYSDSACTSQVADAGTKTVTAGVAPASDPITLANAGQYYWVATYSGDATHFGSASSCGSEVEVVGLVITTTSLANATHGTPYSATLSALGGKHPYKWKIVKPTKLPKGLKLNAKTGVISGTPKTAGTYNFSVLVTDSTKPTKQTAQKPLSILVS